jgi:hypothetical protein
VYSRPGCGARAARYHRGMRERRKSAAAPLVAAFFLTVMLPLCYVLSIGPASRLVSRERLDPKVHGVIYAPLFWCRSRSTAFEQFLEGYVDLWL